MTEIFKTTVRNKTQAKRVVESLVPILAGAKINFDLSDCDRILRIEGIDDTCLQTVIDQLQQLGYHCERLN